MSLFSYDRLKSRSTAEINDIKEHNLKIDKRLMEYKMVLGRYKSCLTEFEKGIKDYELLLEDRDNRAKEYNESFEKLLDNYDRKVQWYEEQQDVYSKSREKGNLKIEEAALDIEELKVRMNRVCIQLEDMKENQVDEISEDMQILLARQEDFRHMLESFEVSLGDRVLLNSSEYKKETLEVYKRDNENLVHKNNKLLSSVRLLLFFQLLSFSAIIFIILLIMDIVVY